MIGLRRAVLSTILGGLALCAVASPVLPEADTDDTACTDDAILVFDASGSMASVGYNELETPRIVEVVEAVRTVLPQVAPYRRIGLVVYGPGPKDACSNIELKIMPELNNDNEIMAELQALVPDGNTPLSKAVLDAAETLNYRERPAVVVLVTDGEETCGGSPCTLGTTLRGEAAAITVHVIGFKVRDRFFQWQSQAFTGEQPTSDSRCLADQTGGQYVTTETTEELVRALQKTLGCPTLSQAGSAGITDRPRP